MMNFYKGTPGEAFPRRLHVVVLSLFAAVLLAFPSQAFAQTGTVRGTVKDAAGEPMIGVNVVIKGTMNGTSTETDGTFTLNGVDTSSGILVVSYLGYATQEIPVVQRTYIDVILEEDVNRLDEVVVIGYGSLSRRELSSSIVQVNKEEFHQGGVNSAMELLTGKVAGVSINNTSLGDPNSGASVQIRGVGTILASSSPLYVIDGIAGGNINNISPQDIESVTVLKDAASSAIYGSRSANGVILVTTKRGQGGEIGISNITYDSWFAVNTAANKPDILSADEFRRSLRSLDYGHSTDWYDALIRDFSYINNQYLSFDGSTRKGGYSASLNYRKGTGIDITSEREEYGGRFAITQKGLDDLIEFNGSINARKVKETWGDNGMFDTALTLNPTYPIYNEDGSYYHPTSPLYIRNPIETMKDEKRGGERVYLTANMELKVNILRTAMHNLNTSVSYSMDYDDLYQHFFTPKTSAASELWDEYEGRASLTYDKWWTNQVEWLANYTFQKNDHTLRAVAGYSFIQNDWEYHTLQNAGFDYDQFLWHNIGSGSALGEGKAGMGSSKERDRQIAVFGRVNYSWKGIVMASASLRHEGSTVFGENNKWGNFPGISAAVEFANTSWMEGYRDIFNSLKLRASYGATGRSFSRRYLSLATYGVVSPDVNRGWRYPIDGEWMQGFGPIRNPNPDLKWETAAVTNIGIDFAIKNRIRGSVEWYDKRSKDLLYEYNVPQPPFIYPNMIANVGTMSNSGVEISLEADICKNKDFQWTSGIIFSYENSKLKTLSKGAYIASHMEFYQLPGIGTNEFLFRTEEGGRIGEFYGYKHAGVDEDGFLLVYDKDNNIIPSTAAATGDNKRVIGNGTPKFYYSWSNTLRYKNFDLNLFFRGAGGYDIFNLRKYTMGMQGCGTDNVLREAYLENKAVTQSAAIISSYYLEKGDYITLENVTLGYTLPIKENRFVSSFRVYFSAKNLFTITGYTGNDPGLVNKSGLTPGIDTAGAYPYTRQFTLGLTVRFK